MKIKKVKEGGGGGVRSERKIKCLNALCGVFILKVEFKFRVFPSLVSASYVPRGVPRPTVWRSTV